MVVEYTSQISDKVQYNRKRHSDNCPSEDVKKRKEEPTPLSVTSSSTVDHVWGSVFRSRQDFVDLHVA
ncbi:hypothetical protein SNE40_017503 [Patella caerulea]|uniref:Uncharacterized protein n=1 Tax=Patella caerulea TaxID=87958 RepID=A0AAN8PE78_PATCE